MFPEATVTVVDAGTSAVAVKVSAVSELNVAWTACPLSTPPSVQFTCVWPLALVVAGVETAPPELPGVKVVLTSVPGVNVTV